MKLKRMVVLVSALILASPGLALAGNPGRPAGWTATPKTLNVILPDPSAVGPYSGALAGAVLTKLQQPPAKGTLLNSTGQCGYSTYANGNWGV